MRRLAALCIAAVLVFSLSGLGGCAGEQSSSAASSDAAAAVDSESSAFEDVAAAFDVSALDLDYSNRDLDASYDEASATRIALSGSSASVDGSGAAVDGSTVTISSEGTYIISGELSSGQIVVDASDDAKVQLVLAGATIHNENGPAIYAKNADKCFVTLADGTQNSLSDGTGYTLEDDSDEPCATLFCRCDLTINGTGALNVTANYRHGICSKDDLVVTGGILNVTAVEDCLRGRDCVKIADGSFSLVAGGDGIKSNKDTKATQGFVSITGGAFSINAGDDAVQAKTYIGITGGTFSVTSADDAFHSDLQMAIAGGDFTVSAGGIAVDGKTPGEGGPAAGGSPVDSGSFPGGSKGGGNRGGAPGAGSSDCLIQVNGGTLVLDSAGDAIDSNGSVEITGGTVLANGPSSDGDGAFDYDSEATVSGGTVLMIGSSRMAQSFSSGTQPFLCIANVSGSAGDTVAIVDANGNVIASITATKQFGMVLASSPKFTEGGEYTLVIGGVLTNTDAHGYTDSGTVTGGSSTSATASATPSSSVGGMESGPGAVGVAR
ncbi:carbohydrate-binding domain-containing protein [Ellagibacter isourolithinifaciens]|uniref:carbohydrate-binding domain-containing protein n=1 Tax=Ellagibacter isourolithinifaciens TaxID=2137581 RepID=UPI003AAED1E0